MAQRRSHWAKLWLPKSFTARAGPTGKKGKVHQAIPGCKNPRDGQCWGHSLLLLGVREAPPPAPVGLTGLRTTRLPLGVPWLSQRGQHPMSGQQGLQDQPWDCRTSPGTAYTLCQGSRDCRTSPGTAYTLCQGSRTSPGTAQSPAQSMSSRAEQLGFCSEGFDHFPNGSGYEKFPITPHCTESKLK